MLFFRLNKIYKPIIQLWQFKVMTVSQLAVLRRLIVLMDNTGLHDNVKNYFSIKFWKCTLVSSRCQIRIQESARMQNFAPFTPELLGALSRTLAVQQLPNKLWWNTAFWYLLLFEIVNPNNSPVQLTWNEIGYNEKCTSFNYHLTLPH